MPPTSADHFRTFNELLNTTLAALSHFIVVLNPSDPSNLNDSDVAPIDKPPNPLHVLRDSASLVKAHTTKLSLLAINKPFTPSALTKILQQLAATCLPAMMSAVHICRQEKAVWGSTMEREVQARVRRVMREMESLVRELQSLAAQEGGARKKNGGAGGGTGRDSLSSTGVVWESCDALAELEKLGVAGLALQKAEQYRDTLRDAIEELKEWAEGADTDTEGFDPLLDEGDEGVDGDRESVEDLFHAANSLPADREDLRLLVEEAGAKLKKVVLLYTAVIKRRLKTWPFVAPSGTQDEDNEEQENRRRAVEKLDKAMSSLKRIPHQVDELASCFYELDEARAKKMLKTCVTVAKEARVALEKSWVNEEDEFTAWSLKWMEAVGE